MIKETEKLDKSSAVAEIGNRLATIDMGRKMGGGCCVPKSSKTNWLNCCDRGEQGS